MSEPCDVIRVCNNNNNGKDFSLLELKSAIRKLKTNKASGCHQILKAFLINANHTTIIIILRQSNVILKSGIVSDDWCMGYITPILKSGDAKDPGNYRGITLLSCMCKFFTNNRFNEFAKTDNIFGPEQAGFKKDHSTINHIFTLKYLIDNSISFDTNAPLGECLTLFLFSDAASNPTW